MYKAQMLVTDTGLFIALPGLFETEERAALFAAREVIATRCPCRIVHLDYDRRGCLTVETSVSTLNP